MHKVFSLGLLILFFCPGSVVGQSKQQVSDFREIKWGTHKDSVFRNGEKVNFKRVKNGVEPNSFTIPNDDMNIGTVEFEEIQYIFNENNRFKKVFLQADRKFVEDMNFILNYKFGKPDRERKLGYVNVKTWKIGEVVFTLSKFKNDRNIFTLTIESNWEKSAEIRKNKNVDDF